MKRNGKQNAVGYAALLLATMTQSLCADDSGYSNRPTPPEPSPASKNDRDPTVPSSKMLERMGAALRSSAPASSQLEPRPKAAAPAISSMPDIRLKAMVFRDADHASAILSVDTKSVRLNLSRTELPGQDGQTTHSQMGFSVGGIHYSVEDFSDRAIRLRQSSDNSVIVVQ